MDTMDEQHKAGASPARFPVLFPNWQSPPLLNQAWDVESVWELGPSMSCSALRLNLKRSRAPFSLYGFQSSLVIYNIIYIHIYIVLYIDARIPFVAGQFCPTLMFSSHTPIFSAFFELVNICRWKG